MCALRSLLASDVGYRRVACDATLICIHAKGGNVSEQGIDGMHSGPVKAVVWLSTAGVKA